jgi:DNA uptake protein ComE-like DNA-binding protein
MFRRYVVKILAAAGVSFGLNCVAASTPVSASAHLAASAPVANSVKVKRKLVDINNAPVKVLITLPGIDQALAKKIIAGRPYGSKAWLASEGVIDPAVYWGLQQLIEARQPYSDGAKNAALYKDRKSAVAPH